MSSHGYPQHQTSHSPERRSSETGMLDEQASAASFATQDHPGAYSMNPYMNPYLGYDSSLPTPISTHGSPIMSGGSPPRMMATFPSSRGSSQQPPTPGSLRHDVEWAGHPGHQMALPSSQRSSPMAMPASVDIMTMEGLETSSPQQHHGNPTSAPDQHYWGSYGMPGTENPDDFLPMLPSQAFYPSAGNPHAVPPTLLSNHPPVSAPPMMLPSSSAQLPAISGPPQHYGGMNMGMGHHQFMGLQPTVVPRRKGAPRKSQTPRARTRRPKKAATPKTDVETSCKAESDSPEAFFESMSEQGEDLIDLHGGADGADEQTLFVYSLWKKYHSQKGKGMWDSILNDWRTRYGPSEKPKLQMKIQRGVFNHAAWPQAEIRALVLAQQEYDNNRYEGILKLMHKYGGAKRYPWKTGHIAKKLVDLDIDEFDPGSKGKKPKCRPKNAAQRQNQSTTNLYDPSVLQQPSTSYAPPQEMGFVPQPPRMSPEELEAMFQSFHCNESDDSPEPDAGGGSAAGTPDLPPFHTAERQASISHAASEMDTDEACGSQMAQEHCQRFMPQEPVQGPFGQQGPLADQNPH